MNSSSRSPILRPEILGIISIVLIALVVRLLQITNHGLTTTDLITWEVMQMSPMEIIRERLVKNHVPLYFLALKLWTSIFGLSEVALRLPSIIVGSLNVAAVWWIGRKLFSARVGLTAALMIALHQLWIYNSLEARLYGPLILFTLVALGGFLLWNETRKWQYAVLYVGAMVAGLATQLLIISLVVSLLGYWFFSLRPRQTVGKKWTAPALLASPLLVLTPLLIAWLNVQDKVGGDPFELPSVGRVWRNLVKVAFGDYEFLGEVGKDIIRPVTVPLLAITIIIAIIWMVKQRQNAELGENPRRSFALLAWVMIPPPVALYIAATSSGSMIGMVRYLSLTMAVAPIGIAAVWWGFNSRLVRAIGLSVIMGAIIVQSAFFTKSEGEGIREAIEFMSSENAPGRSALACSAGGAWLGFTYYDLAMENLYLDRGQTDHDAIHARTVQALSENPEYLYLFIYHSKRSPAPDLLTDETPWLELERTERFGNAKVRVLRVLPTHP